jgi:hypothetical protein
MKPVAGADIVIDHRRCVILGQRTEIGSEINARNEASRQDFWIVGRKLGCNEATHAVSYDDKLAGVDP